MCIFERGLVSVLQHSLWRINDEVSLLPMRKVCSFCGTLRSWELACMSCVIKTIVQQNAGLSALCAECFVCCLMCIRSASYAGTEGIDDRGVASSSYTVLCIMSEGKYI